MFFPSSVTCYRKKDLLLGTEGWGFHPHGQKSLPFAKKTFFILLLHCLITAGMLYNF